LLASLGGKDRRGKDRKKIWRGWAQTIGGILVPGRQKNAMEIIAGSIQ
jgi:hypothetical protein